MAIKFAAIVGPSVLAFALGVSVLPASAQAGFLEQLFGGGQPSAPASPSYGYDQLPQFFPGDDALVPPPQQRRRPVVDAKPKLQKPTDLMHDATLQNGDAVMMKDGIHVYTGDDGEKRHDKADFSALDNVDGMDKRERNALVAMDTTRNDPLSRADAPDTIASGRSAAVASPVVKGREIVDARGKTVRYVGP